MFRQAERLKKIDCKFNELFADNHFRYFHQKDKFLVICLREEITMKQFLLFLLFSAGLLVSAQDVTGIWRGSFVGQQSRIMKMLGDEDRYKFELQIDQKAKEFEGVTYSYKTTVFYGKATCRGTVNPKTKKVLLEELKLVELKMLQGGGACVMTCYLQYSKSGDEEFMEGTYTSYNATDSSNCGSGTLFLRKVVTSDFYKEPFLIAKEKKTNKSGVSKDKNPATKISPKQPEKTGLTKTPAKKPATSTAKPPAKKPVTATVTKPQNKPLTNAAKKPATNAAKKPATTSAPKDNLAKKTTPVPVDTAHAIPKPVDADFAPPEVVKKAVVIPKVLESRENELVKTIFAGSGQISVNIYDNGSVDNDTVSVFLDKKLILSKKRLTERPLTLTFNLDEASDQHELVMVAENLGEIPPNTSLMVVTAGDKKYEVRITSTEQKNAVVVFKLQKN